MRLLTRDLTKPYRLTNVRVTPNGVRQASCRWSRRGLDGFSAGTAGLTNSVRKYGSVQQVYGGPVSVVYGQ